jgi:hypothetical protein
MKCAGMNVSEIWSYSGILISTTIDNTILLSKAAINATKLFYVWDLEWLRDKKDYVYNMQAFRNPQIQLMARSKDHAQAIEKYCNRQVSIVLPNFNLGGLVQIFQQEAQNVNK